MCLLYLQTRNNSRIREIMNNLQSFDESYPAAEQTEYEKLCSIGFSKIFENFQKFQILLPQLRNSVSFEWKEKT